MYGGVRKPRPAIRRGADRRVRDSVDACGVRAHTVRAGLIVRAKYVVRGRVFSSSSKA